jgi:nitrogen fixation protein FixH
MLRIQALVVLTALVLLARIASAADEVPRVQTVQGTIEKVDKETLTIKHRPADSKTDKSMTFKLTGTSRFSTLSTQKRGEKIVLVQKDTEVKNLAAKQPIAVIYATNAGDHVLLAAVVQAD